MSHKGSIQVKDLNFYYGDLHALKNISMDVEPHKIVAMIGPSGCGKSTLIRVFNRMNDLIPATRVEGEVLVDGQDIYGKNMDVVGLRRKVGMVFQKSTPFPKSIYDNIAYGLKIVGIKDHRILNETVEKSLKRAALWEEVKDHLGKSAMSLSGGQQQRLCIARAIAVDPEIILMDEPCSALDPIATARIEELMGTLKDEYTIVIVTHNMQQAARVSDKTAFLMHGQIIEFTKTSDFFTKPSNKITEDYITGKVWLGENMLREKITELKHLLIQDAGLVEDMISRSMRGLLEKNPDMLYQVVKNQEPRVNAYDRSIDELCVQTVAQYEPVARDLRLVIMIIKMNKDLERMADHAVNISESGLYLIANPFLGSYEDLRAMGENTVAMMKDGINAFVNEDIALAQSVCDRDDIVDEAGDKILKDLTDVMKGKKDVIPRALALMRIAHNLERIADLSTNIAEEVVYIVEGRDIKHHGGGHHP